MVWGGGCWHASLEREEQERLNNEYFADFKLVFSGIVVKQRCNLRGIHVNITKLKVTSSNIPEFDERAKHKYYYCVLKDSFAEILPSNFSSFEIGDSVAINGPQNTCLVYRKNILTDSIPLSVYVHDQFNYWENVKDLAEL
jgi:hypothetical protein